MLSFVEAAAMLKETDPVAAAQEPPLPWTEEEELKIGVPVAHPMGKAGVWLRLATLVLAICSAALGFIRMLRAAPASTLPAKGGKETHSSLLQGLGGTGNSQHHWV